MKMQWLMGTAALLVGAAGGYLAGKAGSEAAAAGEQPKMETKTARSGMGSRSSGASAPGEATKRVRSLREIAHEPGQMGRVQALLDRFSKLTPDQFAAEAKSLETLDMPERLMASYLLYAKWAEVAPQEAMAQANKMGFSGAMVRPTVLQGGASVDPAGAAQYVADNPRDFAMMGGGFGRGPGGGQSATAIIAGEWAKQDPTGALAWAQSVQTDRSQAVASVLRQVAVADPRKAADLVASLPADERNSSYDSIASSWGGKNWSEAEAWIKTLPTDQQASAMSAAVRGLAGSDAVAASREIASIPAGDGRSRAVDTVVANWSRDDPAAAARWLMQQNDPAAQRDSMRNLMTNWAQSDNTAAQAFIQAQPVGEVRDSAVSSYVWSNRNANPQQVMQLAETVQDEGSRTRAVDVAAMRWMREDPTAAKAYIQQSTAISDDAKTRILEGRGNGGGRGRGRNPGGG